MGHADPNKADKDGVTPVNVVSLFVEQDIIKHLMGEGADAK